MGLQRVYTDAHLGRHLLVRHLVYHDLLQGLPLVGRQGLERMVELLLALAEHILMFLGLYQVSYQ